MSAKLAQREIVLAGIALLAAVVALAVVLTRSRDGDALPKPVGAWSTVLAGVRAPGGFGKKTACGQVLQPETAGVAHAVLPCGAKLFVAYGGKTVLTQVIDRPSAPGRVLELTAPLAARLDLRGVRPVRWAYAARR